MSAFAGAQRPENASRIERGDFVWSGSLWVRADAVIIADGRIIVDAGGESFAYDAGEVVPVCAPMEVSASRDE